MALFGVLFLSMYVFVIDRDDVNETSWNLEREVVCQCEEVGLES